MKDKNSNRRLALSPEISTLLEIEVSRIRGKGAHYRVNESRLASVLLHLFFDQYMEKERDRIDAGFIDRKAYLNKLVKESSSEDELMEKLDQYLRDKKPRKRRNRSSKQTEVNPLRS